MQYNMCTVYNQLKFVISGGVQGRLRKSQIVIHRTIIFSVYKKATVPIVTTPYYVPIPSGLHVQRYCTGLLYLWCI